MTGTPPSRSSGAGGAPKPIGALLGAGLGFALMKGNLAGAIAGSLLGHLFQKQMRKPAAGPELAVARAAGLVHLAVHVAGADGPLVAAEREAIRTYFRRDAGLPEQHVLAIDRAIETAEAHAAGADAALATMPPLDASDRTHVVFVLYRVALADGDVNAAEESALRAVATGLGVSPADLRAIRGHFVVDDAPAAAEDDFRTLGLEPGANADRVKAKYREAVKNYHPDRFQHLGDEFTSVAAEKFKKIQDAYGRLAEGRPRTDRRPRLSVCGACRAFSPAQRLVCPRCDRAKHEDRGDHVRLKCPFCTRTNAVPTAAFAGEVRCGNCKVLLVR